MKIVLEKKKKGLWANIHAKRKRGEKPAKPGDKDYPDKQQWKKLTKNLKKEELQEIVTEEIFNFLEEEQQLELNLDPQDQIKKAHELTVAAQKDLQSQKSVAAALGSQDPELQQIQRKEKEAKQLAFNFAKEKERKTRETASEEQTVKEEKSNFQKEMERKGKSWKIRLLTKGKQSPGSAYPDPAPMERSKSAPPGAGGS